MLMGGYLALILIGVALFPLLWVFGLLINLNLAPGWWAIAIGIIITLFVIKSTRKATGLVFTVILGISVSISALGIVGGILYGLYLLITSIHWF